MRERERFIPFANCMGIISYRTQCLCQSGDVERHVGRRCGLDGGKVLQACAEGIAPLQEGRAGWRAHRLGIEAVQIDSSPHRRIQIRCQHRRSVAESQVGPPHIVDHERHQMRPPPSVNKPHSHHHHHHHHHQDFQHFIHLSFNLSQKKSSWFLLFAKKKQR